MAFSTLVAYGKRKNTEEILLAHAEKTESGEVILDLSSIVPTPLAYNEWPPAPVAEYGLWLKAFEAVRNWRGAILPDILRHLGFLDAFSGSRIAIPAHIMESRDDALGVLRYFLKINRERLPVAVSERVIPFVEAAVLAEVDSVNTQEDWRATHWGRDDPKVPVHVTRIPGIRKSHLALQIPERQRLPEVVVLFLQERFPACLFVLVDSTGNDCLETYMDSSGEHAELTPYAKGQRLHMRGMKSEEFIHSWIIPKRDVSLKLP